jgi:hypothetical protein
MDFIVGWACPGSLKKCFQLWFYAVIPRSIINVRFEFFSPLMDVCRANNLNLYFEYVNNILT